MIAEKRKVFFSYLNHYLPHCYFAVTDIQQNHTPVIMIKKLLENSHSVF